MRFKSDLQIDPIDCLQITFGLLFCREIPPTRSLSTTATNQ